MRSARSKRRPPRRFGSADFKEAIELYKQLLRGEARQDWRDALAAAYVGRAKALSAKGLFKEAEIVLGNAVALDGAVKEPLFLLSCLIRQGQIHKALAQALKYIGSDALEPSHARLLSELTAALFLARPVPLEAAEGDPPARVEWFAAANAAREALSALTAQEPAIEIERLIADIPARSAFGPVRLILKGLLTDDPAKARRLFDGVSSDSPFGPLRLAAEAGAAWRTGRGHRPALPSERSATGLRHRQARRVGGDDADAGAARRG